MKKILSTILAAALIIGTLIPVMSFPAFADGNATSFSDDFTTTDNWTGDTSYIFTAKPGFGSNQSGNEPNATITTVDQYDFGTNFAASFDLYYGDGNNGAIAGGFPKATGHDYSVYIGDFEIQIMNYQSEIAVLYQGVDINGTSSHTYTSQDANFYYLKTRTFKISVAEGDITVKSYDASGTQRVSYAGTAPGFEAVNNARISLKRVESWQIISSYVMNFSVRKNSTEFSDDFSSDENWTGDTTYINAEKGFGESKAWSDSTKTITAKEHFNLGTEFDSSFKIYTYYSNPNDIVVKEDWQITIGDFIIAVCDFQTRLKVYYRGSDIGGEYVCSNPVYVSPRTLTYLVHIEPGNISITSATLNYTSDFSGFIPQNDVTITLKKNTTWEIHTSYIDDFFVGRNKNDFVADFTSDSQWTGTQGSGTSAINTGYGWFGAAGSYTNSTATVTSKSAFYFGDVVDADFTVFMDFANGTYYNASGLGSGYANTDFIIGIGDFQIGVCDYQTRITVSYQGSNIGGTSTCSDYTYRTDITRNYEVHIEKGFITVQSEKVSYFSSFDDFNAINNAKVSLKLNETWQLYSGYISSFTVSGKQDSIFGFRNHSLILAQEIGVNFFMDLSGLTAAQKTGAYMSFEVTNSTRDIAPAPYNSTDVNESGYYRFTCYVGSTQMAETITPTFHYGSGETITGSTYSVKDYIDYVVAHPEEYTDNTVTLVKALGDYGHYARVYLNNLNGTTNSSMALYRLADYDAEEHGAYFAELEELGVKSEKTVSGITGSNVTYNLNFASATSLNIKVTTASSMTATINGVPADLIKTNTGYTIRIPDMMIGDIDETYTIIGNLSNGATFTIENLSGLSYIRAILNKATDTNGAKNAMSAFYDYYKAAKLYLDPAGGLNEVLNGEAME